MTTLELQERTWWRAALRRVQRSRVAPASPFPRAARPLGLGLVGAGNVARWQHLPALQRHPDRFRLVAVCDADRERANAVAAHGGAIACDSAAALAQHPAVDAVLVCTPTACHAEGVLAALDARKPVVAEKPLAATVDEARRLWESARAAGVATAVNFSFRFRSDFALVRQLIHQGILGEIHQVWGSISQGRWFDADGRPSGERSDAAPWKFAAGGGVVLDLGPHLLDLMRWWFGEIDRVQAWVKSAPHSDENDAACGLGLRFASGACAQLITSRFATGAKEQGYLEINGTKGAVRFDAGQVSLWTRSEPRWRRLMLPPRPPADLLTSFHAAIHGHRVDTPDFWDGYMNNAALAAVFASARLGAAVTLPRTNVGEATAPETEPLIVARATAEVSHAVGIENVVVRG